MLQSQDAKQNGYDTEWEKLQKEKRMSGVGDNTKTCSYQATVCCALSSGEVIKFAAPVIPGDPSPVPPLWGVRSMAAENVFYGTRQGKLAMVPACR